MFILILTVVTTVLMAIFRVPDDRQPWIVALVVVPAFLLGAPAPFVG